MSEIDLLPVYQAIKARLGDLPDLNAYDYVPGSDEWPAAIVMPPTVEIEGLDDGFLSVTFEIVVMVSASMDEHQLKLMAYQSSGGPQSISKTFKAEPTLGGLVGDVRIQRSRPLSYEEQAGYSGYGAVFEARARIG